MRTIPGIYVHAGAANFLLVELVDEALDARTLYQKLGRRGLLIRVCDSFRGLAKGRFIRLSVRTHFGEQPVGRRAFSRLRRVDSESCMKAISVLGTSSNSGKSWFATALCALLRRKGLTGSAV